MQWGVIQHVHLNYHNSIQGRVLHTNVPGKHQAVLGRYQLEQSERASRHLLQQPVGRIVRGWGRGHADSQGVAAMPDPSQ